MILWYEVLQKDYRVGRFVDKRQFWPQVSFSHTAGKDKTSATEKQKGF